MNKQIRRVGVVLVALFAALFLQLNYLQVVRADHLANHPRNVRTLLHDYTLPRGQILTEDGEIVARSVPSDDELKYQRVYPLGALLGHLSGAFSFTYGASGIERAFNDELTGKSQARELRNLGDLLAGKEHTGTVVLGINAAAQRLARDAIRQAGERGSVVVLDPITGKVVVMYSEPSFDPTPLAGHKQLEVTGAYEALDSDAAKPMLARAFRERYAPGSTFKIVTAATAIDTGMSTPESVFPELTELDLPQTNNALGNFGGKRCGGTLASAFRVSCNTVFAQLGLDLGERLALGVQAFGIGDTVPFDLPVARSAGPERGSFKLDQPSFANAAIGQGDVAVTPLQMALVTAAIANDGAIMRPYLVTEVRDVDGAPIKTTRPRVWKQAVTQETAGVLKAFMVDVVERGTGTAAKIPGVTVAGKTGTAQAPGGPPHAWFVGFAPAENPRFVIAVLVERGGSRGDEATGGRVAAPVARKVLAAVLGRG